MGNAHQEYPKVLYHRRLAPKGEIFEDADKATLAVEQGWVDSPGKFPKPSELSLEDLREDFLVADEEFQQATSNGSCDPGSNRWEQVSAKRTSAKDLYDFRLREAELSNKKSKLPHSHVSKVKVFQTALGNYDVRGILGEGSNGIVYDVQDETGDPWAIKCLKPEALQNQKRKRFKNEIAFLLRANHPNLVTITDWGLVQVGEFQVPFFVMPRYPSTLRKQMSEGILPSDALRWYLQLLAGMEAAHELGACHRDLKPENLLCNPSTTTLVVADFGIARIPEELLETVVQTRAGDRLANAQYSAPEQRRPGLVDHRADIYALGLILNELFTGEVLQGTGHKRIATVVPEFSYLDELVDRMVRQSPSERPTSVTEIREELAAKGIVPKDQPPAAGC